VGLGDAIQASAASAAGGAATAAPTISSSTGAFKKEQADCPPAAQYPIVPPVVYIQTSRGACPAPTEFTPVCTSSWLASFRYSTRQLVTPKVTLQQVPRRPPAPMGSQAVAPRYPGPVPAPAALQGPPAPPVPPALGAPSPTPAPRAPAAPALPPSPGLGPPGPLPAQPPPFTPLRVQSPPPAAAINAAPPPATLPAAPPNGCRLASCSWGSAGTREAFEVYACDWPVMPPPGMVPLHVEQGVCSLQGMWPGGGAPPQHGSAPSPAQPSPPTGAAPRCRLARPCELHIPGFDDAQVYICDGHVAPEGYHQVAAGPSGAGCQAGK
jgi:hypothetical protein